MGRSFGSRWGQGKGVGEAVKEEKTKKAVSPKKKGPSSGAVKAETLEKTRKMSGSPASEFKKSSGDLWFVYMLKCGDGSLYTGSTNDVARRVKQHAQGKGAAYTRSHLPVELAYVEQVGPRGDALRREAQLKALPRREKCHLVEAFRLPVFEKTIGDNSMDANDS